MEKEYIDFITAVQTSLGRKTFDGREMQIINACFSRKCDASLAVELIDLTGETKDYNSFGNYD